MRHRCVCVCVCVCRAQKQLQAIASSGTSIRDGRMVRDKIARKRSSESRSSVLVTSNAPSNIAMRIVPGRHPLPLKVLRISCAFVTFARRICRIAFDGKSGACIREIQHRQYRRRWRRRTPSGRPSATCPFQITFCTHHRVESKPQAHKLNASTFSHVRRTPL